MAVVQRVRVRFVSVLLAVVMAMAVAPSTAVGQLDLPLVPGVNDGPTFNNPASLFTSSKDRIKSHLLGLIRGTPSGSYIRVALYRLNDADMANALVTAHRNGVKVRAILDSRNANRQSYRILRSGLGTSRASRSWVKLCGSGRGCLGEAINHNKFWMFSRTKGAYRVVVQSSSNMGSYSYRHQWNSAHTYVASDGAPKAGAPKNVYDAFRNYFDGMTVHSYARFERTQAFGNDRTYFFPQRYRSHGDPVANVLDKVTCVDPTTGRRSTIRIAMFRWTRTSVAYKVMQKVKQGCQVSIAYSQLSSRPWKILHPSSGAKPTMRCYVDLDSSGHPQAYIHSKYLLIDGLFYGRQRRMVLTGSPNFTYAAVWKNDEAMLRTDGGYTGYLRNFNQITLYAEPGTNEKASLCQGQPFRS